MSDDFLRVTHVVLSMECGGLESVVLGLVRESRRLGQRVAVACLERTGTLAAQADALGARVVCIDKRPGLRLGSIGRLESLLRELGPDVVHSHHIGALFYSGPAARRARVPLVVHTEHGQYYGARRRTRWLGRLAGWHAARFWCVSPTIAAEAEAYRIVPRRKIQVVPNGIDLDRFRARDDAGRVRQSVGIPPGAPTIGTIGRVCEIKRQDLLIRAFQQVRSRVEDAHLLIVGDGPWMGLLRGLVAGLNLADRVHFAGYQPHPERYLQAMDVFSLTSQSEGMPLTILEAWAACVPVVATRVGGVPELVEDGRTGVLVDFDDVSALAQALGDLLADTDLTRRLCEAGRDRVEPLSLKHMADAYQNHYLELLGRGRPARCGS
jgi:glycosyltransferase involved in cell wall biosynthesis